MNSTLIKRPLMSSFSLNVILATAVLITLTALVAATLRLEFFVGNITLLLFLNLIGIILLFGAISVYLVRIHRRKKAGVPGTSLTISFLKVFAVLTLTSLGVVYLVSFVSITSGVDRWFGTQVGEAVQEANQLRELFIESVEAKLALDLEQAVSELSQTTDRREISDILFEIRETGNHQEITYFEDLTSPTGIIASSGLDVAALVPQRPSETLIGRVLNSQTKEPEGEIFTGSDDSAQLRMLIPVSIADQDKIHYLQVITILPRSSQRLAEKIGSVNQKYEQLVYLRTPSKISFLLTLSFVTLITILLSIFAAIDLTQRLVAPIRTLAEGTQSVARGNYKTLLPVTRQDDFGVLVELFNDMTQKIKSSRDEIRNSQLLTEQQRSYLEVILTHLTSGVLSINGEGQLTDLNLAAGNILSVESDSVKGLYLSSLKQDHPELEPLFYELRHGIKEQKKEWGGTVQLETLQGQQVLQYSSSRLPVGERTTVAYVVVIEDITELVKAQRGAAWEEIAKRLAHEILNPLQPIQLAVDRIRLKTKRSLSSEDSESLEKAYGAIYRQLNVMQRIVRVFREYEKLSVINAVRVNLNKLVHEVVELHDEADELKEIVLDLDPNIDEITADPDQMVQMFNNLLINAKDATKNVTHSVVSISTRPSGPHSITVQISDNGPGFSSSVVDRLFEPYATTKQKGTGLGLSIVKRIVESHGGTITASNLVGGGAQIKIEFDTQFSFDKTSVN